MVWHSRLPLNNPHKDTEPVGNMIKQCTISPMKQTNHWRPSFPSLPPSLQILGILAPADIICLCTLTCCVCTSKLLHRLKKSAWICVRPFNNVLHVLQLPISANNFWFENVSFCLTKWLLRNKFGNILSLCPSGTTILPYVQICTIHKGNEWSHTKAHNHTHPVLFNLTSVCACVCVVRGYVWLVWFSQGCELPAAWKRRKMTLMR